MSQDIEYEVMAWVTIKTDTGHIEDRFLATIEQINDLEAMLPEGHTIETEEY